MSDKTHEKDQGRDAQSCDGRVSRKEFLTTVIRRASIAGALLAAPQVIDKFLIPPAYAVTSTTHTKDTSVSSDTNHFHDQTSVFHDQTNHFHDGGTSHFHDASPSDTSTNDFG